MLEGGWTPPAMSRTPRTVSEIMSQAPSVRLSCSSSRDWVCMPTAHRGRFWCTMVPTQRPSLHCWAA